jgi:hypothetical protein
MLGGDMSNGSDAQLGTWLTVGVLIGLALALLVGVLVVGVRRARRVTGSRRRPVPRQEVPPAPAAPGPAGPTFPIDDLPGFAERPPGWTAGPTAVPSGATADRTGAPGPGAHASPGEAAGTGPDHRTGADAAGDGPGPADLGRAGTSAVAAAVLLLVAAILVAFTLGGSGAPVASARSDDATTAPAPSDRPDPTPSPPAAPPAPSATETAAAALAFQSVTLGRNGTAASVTFQGVVLEQRAVGLTVTYPSVSVSTDGRRSLAHVRLPTFNCLTAEPPADPVAAGCARSLTEYADLASPALQVSRDGGRLDVLGLFPTYTRSNGSAPAYTGRAYQLTAAITADGPERNGQAPAAGVVRIGLDSAPTTADRGVNLLQLPG